MPSRRTSPSSSRAASAISTLDDAAPAPLPVLLHQVIEQRYEPGDARRPGGLPVPGASVLDLDPLLLPRAPAHPPRPEPRPPVWDEPDPREDRARRLRQVAVWAAGSAGGVAALVGALAIGV